MNGMDDIDEARKVLAAYQSKFNRFPEQPFHLISFSKSRSDLPNLNYQKSRNVLHILKNLRKGNINHDPKSKSMPNLALADTLSLNPQNAMQIAEKISLPQSPKASPKHQSIFQHNEGATPSDEGDHYNDNDDDDDDDDDELLYDGNHTTNINTHTESGDNHSVQCLKDWCFDHGLTVIYDKLITSGYKTCKMLSKCSDEQVETISRDLEFTIPQQLIFKVAIDELRMADFNSNYHLRHPEEHRSLTDIAAKIAESETLMTMFYDKRQSMNTEIYAFQMDVQREFDIIIQELNKRKMILLNQLNNFFMKKKNIIQRKQETLNRFIIETNSKKKEIMCMLQDDDMDINKMEERKKKIMNIHDGVIMEYMNVKKAQYEGFPTINTSFPSTHNMLKQIARFGEIEENSKNTLGVMPVISSIDNCGKDTKIKIKWELTNDHYGIDPDTVKSIRIEWIEVNEEEMQSEIEECVMGVFGSTNGAKLNRSRSAWSYDDFKRNDEEDDIKVTLNRWMSKHIRFSLYKAIDNVHQIDVRKYGKFLVRIKLLGAEHALASNYVTSNVFSILVQRKGIYFVRDKWDNRTKHLDLKIGLVNKKIISRAVPGRWKNCFGSTAVYQGVNIWRVLLKKRDNNRKAFSCMIGVMDATKAGYIDTNFTEIGGYGMYINNGNIFHDRKRIKYYDPNKKGLRAIRCGDILSVIVDYYRGIISFKINEYDCGVAWSNINTLIAYKLCISMRGCDEIKLLDQDNNNIDKDKRKHMFLKRKKRNNHQMDLNIDIAQVQQISNTSRFGVSKTPEVKQSEHKRTFSAKNIFGKIRRHSANSEEIENDRDGLNNVNIEKNKMKSKKSKHKQSRSFFNLRKNKTDKEIERLQQNLKNLNDESDDKQSVYLNGIIMSDDEMSYNEPNVLL